jgi:hypothetical protein
MASVIFREETPETRDEPITSRYHTMSSEPKFPVQWEELVSRLEVPEERQVWIGRFIMFLDEDCVALKREVSFVRGQEEREKIRFDLDRLMEGNLVIITILLLVRKN